MRERSRIEIVDGASRSSRARTALEPRRERARDDGRARRIVARTRARPDPEFPRRDERSRRSNVVARRGAPFGTSRDADDRSRVATVALARARVRPESSLRDDDALRRASRSLDRVRARAARARTPNAPRRSSRRAAESRAASPVGRARRTRHARSSSSATTRRARSRDRVRDDGAARAASRSSSAAFFFRLRVAVLTRGRGATRRDATTRGPNRRRRIVTSTRAERWPRASRDRRSPRSRATREGARRRARRAPRPRRRPRRRCPSSPGTSTACASLLKKAPRALDELARRTDADVLVLQETKLGADGRGAVDGEGEAPKFLREYGTREYATSTARKRVFGHGDVHPRRRLGEDETRRGDAVERWRV